MLKKEMKESSGNEYIRTVKAQCWKFYCWNKCLGCRCDEVQWWNYRLDERGITENGQNEKENNDIEQVFAPKKYCGQIIYESGGRGLISAEESIK